MIEFKWKNMKNLQAKINVIFTGKYLKFWYIACFIVLSLLVWDIIRKSSVSSYDLLLFDNNGEIISQRKVSRMQAFSENEMLPITKSYHPIK